MYPDDDGKDTFNMCSSALSRRGPLGSQDNQPCFFICKILSCNICALDLISQNESDTFPDVPMLELTSYFYFSRMEEK